MNFRDFLQMALKKAGKQDQLAIILDLSPSALSKRLNGEVGWAGEEINRLLEYTGCEVANSADFSTKIEAFKTTLKIILNDTDTGNR